MRVSDFPIGRGEVYVGKRPQYVGEVIEVIAVQRTTGGGRSVSIANHRQGRRVPGTERLVFNATSFLSCYRPATVADFTEER